MQINPYLNFNGTCEEAFRLYESAIGGQIVMMMKMGESPMAQHTPPEMKDKIMHVSMKIGDNMLMGSDSPPEHPVSTGGTYVSLHLDSLEETERIFAQLSEGGNVIMAPAETFWAERFGMFIDRFGTSWMLNFEGNKRVPS